MYFQLVLLLLISLPAFADETTYQLEGPRKPEIKIITSSKSYNITIRMVPVRCFDDDTTMILNQRKAANYVHIGLHRIMKLTTDQYIQIRNKNLPIIRIDNNALIYSVTIPNDSVDVSRISDSHDNRVTLNEIKSDIRFQLLTAKNEYIETLKFIEERLVYEFPLAEQIIDLEYSVANYEDRINELLSNISEEIRSEQLLLELEKEELISEVKFIKKNLIDQLKNFYEMMQY